MVFGAAPPPPSSAVTLDALVAASQARAGKYTAEQVAAAFEAAGVPSVGLETKPELWALAIEALDASCPV